MLLKNNLSVLVLICMGLVCSPELLGQEQREQTGVTNINVESPVRDWVVDRASGRIFAATPDEQCVIELDRDGQVVRKIDLPLQPHEMIIKNGKKLVVCMGDSLHDQKLIGKASVAVIELATNEIFGVVEIEEGRIGGLFCSQADNAFVGVANHLYTPQKRTPNQLLQIDIDSLDIRKTVDIKDWDQDDATHIAMSADGQWIACDSRGRTSPGGGNISRVNEDEFTFELHWDPHAGYGRLTPGPANQHWLFGDEVFPIVPQANADEDSPIKFGQKLDRRQRRAARGFANPYLPSGIIHHQHDLVIVRNGPFVSFSRLSDAVENEAASYRDHLKRISIQSLKNPDREWTKSREQLESKVFVDDEGNVYACFHRTCNILSLEELEISTKPLFALDIPRTLEVAIDEPFSVDLAVRDHKADSVQFSAEGLPEGAQLTGNRITWPAASHQVGRFELKIIATANDGELKHASNLSLICAPLTIPTNILPNGIVASSDGQHAVIWGKSKKEAKEFSHPIHRVNGPQQIAVIDLNTRNIIATSQFGPPIQSVTLHGQYVFVAMKIDLHDLALHKENQELREIRVFDRETFAPVDRILMPGAPYSFKSISGNKIGVLSKLDHHSANFSIIDPANLKILESADVQSHPVAVTPYAVRNATQIEIYGRIYDTQLEKVVSLNRQPTYDPIFMKPQNNRGSNHRGSNHRGSNHRDDIRNTSGESIDHRYPFQYGRQLQPQARLGTPSGKQLVMSHADPQNRYKDVKLFFSDQAPICQRITCSGSPRTYKLHSYRLVDGEQIGEPTLLFTEKKKRTSNANGCVAVSDGKLLIAGEEVLAICKPPTLPADIESPFYLAWPNKPVLEANEQHQFTIPHFGGKEKIEFALEEPVEGVSIDSSSGELQINTPELWSAYLVNAGKSKRPDPEVARAIEANNARRKTGAEQPATPSEVFAANYGYELGLSKIPTYLPVKIVATDGEGQIAKLLFYVTIVGDADDLATVKKEMQQKDQAARERQENWNKAGEGFGEIFEKAVKEKIAEGDEKREARPERERPAPKLDQEEREKQKLDEIEQRIENMESTTGEIIEKLKRLREKGK